LSKFVAVTAKILSVPFFWTRCIQYQCRVTSQSIIP